MVKTGIHDWFGYRIDNEERFKLIREAGFNSVLFWWGDEYADYVGDKNFLPGLARNAGLEIENVHAPFYKTNLIWTESVDAEDIVKRYAQCIIDCSNHNIPTVVIHLTNGDTPPPHHCLV